MGYISDVEGLIYGPPEVIDAYVAADALTNKFLLDVSNEDWSFRKFDRGRFYDGEWEYDTVKVIHLSTTGKWYEGYPDVKGWESFMYGAPDFDDQLNYEFIRVGEDDNDIERESSGGWEVLWTPPPSINHHEVLYDWETTDAEG